MHFLGFSFTPRIRDLGETKLYLPGGNVTYTTLAALIGGKINSKQIRARGSDGNHRRATVATVRLPECTVFPGSPDAHHGGIWKMGGHGNCGDLRLVTHFGKKEFDQRCTKKPKLLGYLSFLFKSGRFN